MPTQMPQARLEMPTVSPAPSIEYPAKMSSGAKVPSYDVARVMPLARMPNSITLKSDANTIAMMIP
jgi:hypothetical protein